MPSRLVNEKSQNPPEKERNQIRLEMMQWDKKENFRSVKQNLGSSFRRICYHVSMRSIFETKLRCSTPSRIAWLPTR